MTKLGAGLANNSSSAFYECGNIKSIKLPSSVYEIGYYAFQNCFNLTNVGSTENITTILTDAFRGCRSLAQDVDLPNLTKLSNGAFNGTAITYINIGKATEIIGAYQNGAFCNCSELRSVEYDENLLTKIGQYTFANCSKLIIDIPINATTIGSSAFLNCSSISIENLVLSKLESIGDNVFSGVNIKRITNLGKITTLPTANTSKQNFGNKSVLEVVVLPSTLTTIAGASFNGYAKLTAVVLLATTPVSLEGTNAFTNTNNCPFYVPDASVEAYKTATNWSAYASRIKGISELPTDNAELYEEIKDYLN